MYRQQPASPERLISAPGVQAQSANSHSHSIVAGGLPLMSYTTRLMPRTSLMMRLLTLPQQAVGQLGPVRGHEVLGLHGAQRHHVFVGAAIAHHADALHRQEHGEGLAGLVVPVGGAQLVDEDGVGAAQQVGEVLADLAQDAHAQAGAREGVAIDHLVRQAQGDAQLADLVLEQLAQRLEQLEVERLRQAADVVVALDGVRLAGSWHRPIRSRRVDGALGQPLGVGQLLGLGLEDLDELAADDLALLLRVGDALQVPHELLGGIHVDDPDMPSRGRTSPSPSRLH
jgi:hypothetical protein